MYVAASGVLRTPEAVFDMLLRKALGRKMFCHTCDKCTFLCTGIPFRRAGKSHKKTSQIRHFPSKTAYLRGFLNMEMMGVEPMSKN